MPTQAVVHIVENGGRHTPAELCSQWEYLCRKGKLELKRSKRYGEAVVPHDQLPDWARTWLEQTGRYYRGQLDEDSDQQLTTHLVVPFARPATALPGEDYDRYHDLYIAAAEHIAREWASEMFDSRNHGGRWDYVTAFHTDRPHPHLHVVVNRESFPDLHNPERTTLLSISPENELINCNSMRDILVEVTNRLNEDWQLRHDPRANLIQVEASSRAERGIPGPSPTTAQYRQRERVRAAARNFTGDAQNTEFDFTAPAPNAGAPAQGPRIGQQPGATQQGGGQGGLDQQAGPAGPLRRQQIWSDPQVVAVRVDAWRQGVAAALSADGGQAQPPTERAATDERFQIDDERRHEAEQFRRVRRGRANEERTSRDTEDSGRNDRRRTPARQSEDREMDRQSTPARLSNTQDLLDAQLRGEGERNKGSTSAGPLADDEALSFDGSDGGANYSGVGDRPADEEERSDVEMQDNIDTGAEDDQLLIDQQLRTEGVRNNCSAAEGPPRLTDDEVPSSGGNDGGANDAGVGDRPADEEDRSDVEMQDNVDTEAAAARVNHRRGNSRAQVRSQVATRGQQLRRLLEERRRRRRGDHIDWTIETRGQERARLAAEAQAGQQRLRGDEREGGIETRAQRRARLRADAEIKGHDVPETQSLAPQIPSGTVRQVPPAGQQGSSGSGGIDNDRSDPPRTRTRERNARSREH
ncbi:MAG: hypothetical protein EOR16_30225 [Mesorhizobium sp.]|uniref:relaxase/mobilization nuclease domain-containing protein n=1 Tax=Mesorhizobium sp. TaxID=1871066 RepID=UPI000FE7E80B|nr:relaxase/mobilization nuclease domain-containing protein [Mesorhizobium sp.]RWI50538.1 MAG: hypothetical protein EOR16_30225 [Mesorhizobium sp.]